MSYGETITRNDLKNILDEVIPQASGEYMFVGSQTGSTAITLPNNWIEINVVGKFGLNGTYGFSQTFTRKQIETYSLPYRFFGGSYISGNDFHSYCLEFSGSTSVKLQAWIWANNDVLSSSTIYVWARTGNSGQSTADYIVEQGTNANGTYRKWNSGFAECWGSASISSGGYTGKWTFPCAFVDKSKIVVHMTPVDSTTTAWNVNYGATTTTQADIGRTPNTATNVYYMSAVGTWK